jgi:hypothetical protein
MQGTTYQVQASRNESMRAARDPGKVTNHLDRAFDIGRHVRDRMWMVPFPDPNELLKVCFVFWTFNFKCVTLARINTVYRGNEASVANDTHRPSPTILGLP